MDAPHKPNGQAIASLTRRESLGSQDSQTAKEYALPLSIVANIYRQAKSN
jgi:hypothetical protein